MNVEKDGNFAKSSRKMNQILFIFIRCILVDVISNCTILFHYALRKNYSINYKTLAIISAHLFSYFRKNQGIC